MNKTDHDYQAYLKILREELVPATGCTEPVAIAYAAAVARDALGAVPDLCEVRVSANIIKNALSAAVPNTGGLKGIAAAAAAGIAAGRSEAMLEVLADVSEADHPLIREYLDSHEIRVMPAESDGILYIEITLHKGRSYSKILILNFHTNIVLLEKDGKILFQAGDEEESSAVGLTDRGILSVEKIIDFADTLDIADVEDVISRQIDFNSAICAEGLANRWGEGIGKLLLETYGDSPMSRARAAAAAGSDARMSGCGMPVIIVSGSGNQGITASMPVIEYAKALGSDKDRLYRALVVSDLITIHQKTGIGRLSAFCGAVSAGCGAGAGIAYLNGGGFNAIAHTIVNALAVTSGIVCDGAKPSCAAKIALAVEGGILGYNMFVGGRQFRGGDGIVAKGVENTIANVGRLAREGMKETDREILRIMVGD